MSFSIKKVPHHDAFAADAALSPEDRAGLVNDLKLQKISGQRADVLESSTVVRKHVEALKDIQRHHDALEAKFFKEGAALEAQYQKLYEPLYIKRYEIVNGIVEPEGVKSDNAVKLEEGQETEKGVPKFWLSAMKTNAILALEISEHDEEALKYLKDIKWSRIDDRKGFKLDFFFDTNPFFKDSVLTKTCHMIDDEEPILEEAIGTDIVWCPGKCLTHDIQKEEPNKGSKNAKPCKSFFNLFSPLEVPKDDDDLNEDAAEKLEYQVEQDYNIGSTIRDKIIPHAVSWFTGEAAHKNRKKLYL